MEVGPVGKVKRFKEVSFIVCAAFYICDETTSGHELLNPVKTIIKSVNAVPSKQAR